MTLPSSIVKAQVSSTSPTQGPSMHSPVAGSKLAPWVAQNRNCLLRSKNRSGIQSSGVPAWGAAIAVDPGFAFPAQDHEFPHFRAVPDRDAAGVVFRHVGDRQEFRPVAQGAMPAISQSICQ